MATAQKWTETNQILAHIPADSETTAVDTGWVSVGDFHRIVSLISVGDLATNATLNAVLQQDNIGDGTNAKAIGDGKAITQLTEAGGDGNQIVAIELNTSELDVSGGFNYIRLTITPATAAAEFAAFLIGFDARYAPVPTTAFQEIV